MTHPFAKPRRLLPRRLPRTHFLRALFVLATFALAGADLRAPTAAIASVDDHPVARPCHQPSATPAAHSGIGGCACCTDTACGCPMPFVPIVAPAAAAMRRPSNALSGLSDAAPSATPLARPLRPPIDLA